ncbi:Uncharacterized protein Fot_32684 [Forsythia ovata]|uniref:Uncharacterized protein n=1 Tax=Forsythia ovata TaxID=205694 RepID=A0ABD1T8I1_9LAMI
MLVVENHMWLRTFDNSYDAAVGYDNPRLRGGGATAPGEFNCSSSIDSACTHVLLLWVTPNSVLQRRHGSQMKFKEPIRSRMSIRGASHGKKARKRASAASHDSSKPMKMPKLGIREASNFSMPKRMTCVNFEGDTEVIGQSFESDFAKNKAKIVACGEHNNDKDEHIVLTGKDSFSGTGTARSGPVKLTTRAKHILKACQKLDQNSSESTHSITSYPVLLMLLLMQEDCSNTRFCFPPTLASA